MWLNLVKKCVLSLSQNGMLSQPQIRRVSLAHASTNVSFFPYCSYPCELQQTNRFGHIVNSLPSGRPLTHRLDPASSIDRSSVPLSLPM